MAMTPYTINTQGNSWYYDAYTNTLTLTNRPLSGKSLGSIISVHGNYRAPNRHSYRKTVWRGYFGLVQQFYGNKLDSYRQGTQPYPYSFIPFLDSGYDENIRNQALSDAYESLRGNVDVSIDLVQWRKVMQMISLHRRLIRGIASEAKRMIPYIERAESLKRDLLETDRRTRRAKRMARELNKSLNYIAEKRLEYVYGWRPLATTLRDLAIQASTPQAPGYLKVEGKGKRFHRFTRSQTSIAAGVPVIHDITSSERCKVVMYFTPQQTVLDNLSKIASLNPVSILYEATPFSFVADWLYNMSGWFRALETAFMHRNDFVGGFNTRTKRQSVASRCVGRDPASGTSFATYSLQGDAVVTYFDREVYTSAPFPSRPVRQFQFGTGRQLNAIALAKAVLFRGDKLLSDRR